MRIHKVKQKDRVTVVYSTENKEGKVDDYSLSCNEKPLPSFTKAMNALVDHVLEICELGDEQARSLTVTGVSFNYQGDEEIMGAVITAEKNLDTANAPLVLNTPHLPSRDASAHGDQPVLTPECVTDLLRLQQEAEKYVNGQRLQMQLKLDDDKKGAKKAAEQTA